MKRNEIISKLMNEGFSEKTLVNFNDKQLGMLAERIIATLDAVNKNPSLKAIADNPTKTIEVKEVDKPVVKKTTIKDDEVDEAARTLANGWHGGLPKMKYKAGTKRDEKKLDTTKKSDFNFKKPKIDDDEKKETKKIEKPKINGKFAKNLKPKNELTEWVEKLVENNYYSLTTKNEIMELIQSKMNGTELVDEQQYSPDVKPAPVKEPGVKEVPKKRPAHPGKNPNPGINPAPKAGVKQISPEEAKNKVIDVIKNILNN